MRVTKTYNEHAVRIIVSGMRDLPKNRFYPHVLFDFVCPGSGQRHHVDSLLTESIHFWTICSS